MTGKNFFEKLFSTYVAGHVTAIAIVVALLCIGVKYGVAYYTHHGESFVVPNVVGMQLEEAEKKMSEAGLQLVVQDTNYVRTMPPDCVLEQSPGQGKRIKSTHIVYVTINAANPPALVMPDLADNSSYPGGTRHAARHGIQDRRAQIHTGREGLGLCHPCQWQTRGGGRTNPCRRNNCHTGRRRHPTTLRHAQQCGIRRGEYVRVEERPYLTRGLRGS